MGGRQLGGDPAEFERSLDANALFLAEDDGRPLGFVTAWLEDHFARSAISTPPRPVDARDRRLLVDTCDREPAARGATHLFLNANTEALEFYERLGFREDRAP